MLNIPSTVNDPKYRYRMPKMALKTESKGNGIKTNIVNLGDIAKHLRTDQEYILKFFGFEKASQTTFKEAGGKNNTNYIISGDFAYEDLLRVLDKFIEKYICCPRCKLPEMHMIVINQKITGKCDSCPFVGELDNKHRLTAFILKNPPVAKNMATGKKEKEKVQVSNNPNTYVVIREKKEKQEEKIQNNFSADCMDFGSEELEAFVIFIRKLVEELKDQDFDIKSAKIVAQIKPIGLKKPLVAYSLFKCFFSVNISSQLAEHSKLYLNLMKKLVSNPELETLLNLEYTFLELGKEKDYSKYLPTILHNIAKSGLLSEPFLLSWFKNEIHDIEKNFLYSQQRDQLFKKAAEPYLESLLEDDSENENEEQPAEISHQESHLNQEQKIASEENSNREASSDGINEIIKEVV